MPGFADLAALIAVELGLFAAVLFLLFGFEDMLVDALRLAGLGRSTQPVAAAQRIDRRFAILVPAWAESGTIGPMLHTMTQRWRESGLRFYVGVYPNDLATMLSVMTVAARDPRIAIVINDTAGPTTKGGCLNRLWRAVAADGASGMFVADAVVLHDAEDVVDAAELSVYCAALAHADYVQLPVVPIPDPKSRWIGGHYCDEFAEAHQKDLPVRTALGAPLPLAGVGCAISMAALRSMADARGPFPADSVTEDYELGLRLALNGWRGRFVVAHGADGRVVATRSYFPGDIEQAVRQKTRWMQGIALDGWDRIGWPGMRRVLPGERLAAWWMLWRDRRAVLAAVAILCGYLAFFLLLAGQLFDAVAVARHLSENPALVLLTMVNLLLLLWRALVRMLCVYRIYGWHECARSLLRMPVANILLVMTARRALWRYWLRRRGAPVTWDKTEHQFPANTAALGARQ